MIRIAIDGPGGAGKSTIAKLVSKKLGIEYIDTGAMYRAIGLKLHNSGIKPENQAAVKAALDSTTMDFETGNIILDNDDVSKLIRTPDVSKYASIYSQIPSVREKLVKIQRQIANGKSVIMDGRDIGTNVLQDAELKIFLTADPMVRAKRRFDELKEKGIDANLDAIFADIKERDYQDTHRKLNPLARAKDAKLVDTTSLSIDEVVDLVVDLAKAI